MDPSPKEGDFKVMPYGQWLIMVLTILAAVDIGVMHIIWFLQ